jgi:hypothetical protein
MRLAISSSFSEFTSMGLIYTYCSVERAIVRFDQLVDDVDPSICVTMSQIMKNFPLDCAIKTLANTTLDIIVKAPIMFDIIFFEIFFELHDLEIPYSDQSE